MSCPIRKTLLSVAVSASLAGPALANPTGPQVVHGSASFAQPGPGQLQVTNSPGAIINWQGFSIGANELTRFIQQNSGSAVLNRVTGNLPSEILGQLSSNGRVFLINPNGLAIGNGARIDTAGFLASTLNLTDADFLAGRLNFAGGGGKIENRGYIRVGSGGEVVLLAPDIENSGIIQADGGKILLAAGREITLASLDLEGVQFRVQAPSDRVLNLGELIAANGAVGVFAGTLTHSGSISATRATRGADGLVRLEAGDRAEVFGSIDVSGSGDAPGGAFSVTAPTVALRGASVDASGPGGGGTVLVGGDYQGGGTLQRSQRTEVDAATTIHADATGSGPGGRVVIWSDGDTRTHGLLTARGGPAGGDGGLVETSGKRNLDFSTPADVSAPRGKPGTWLLDPEDITIDAGKAESIESALNAGSSVAVKTSDSGAGEGNITVASSINKSEGGDASLSMEAHNKIDVNAPITSEAAKLDVSLAAGKEINVNSTIETNGGKYSSTLTGATTTVPAGNVTAGSTATTGSGTAPSSTTADGSTSPDDATSTGTAGAVTSSTSQTSTAGATSTSTTQQTVALSTSGTPPPTTTTSGTNSGSAGGTTTSTTTSTSTATGGTGTAPTTTQTASTTGTSSTTNGTAGATSVTSSEPVISIKGEVATKGGDIFVNAGPEGTTYVYGTLDASNTETGSTGGNVTLLGDKVGLFDQAKVDASGDAGGGTVLIGGDRQGLNPDVRNASAVYTGPETSVKADALANGDGGRIIVFADTAAQIYGKLSARGGAEGGNGGFIETSGLATLILNTVPDVSAPRGQSGEWLIDPHFDLTICDNCSPAYPDNVNIDNTTNASPGWFPTASGAFVEITNIVNFFQGTTNGTLTITTENTGVGPTGQSGNITWADGMSTDGFSNDGADLDTLNLVAGGNITFNAWIYDTFGGDADSLNLGLTAGGTVLLAGSLTSLGDGNLTINAPNTLVANASYVSAGGNLNAANSHIEIQDDSSLNVGGNATAQHVTMLDTAWFGVGGTLNVTGTLTLDAPYDANLTYSGQLDLGGAGAIHNVGHLNWVEGIINVDNDGTLRTQGADLTGDGPKTLNGTWEAHGTTNWTGGDLMNDYDDGELTVYNQGTFNANPANGTTLTSHHAFINLGVFNKNGAGDVEFDGGALAEGAAFQNHGTVNVNAGEMTVYATEEYDFDLEEFVFVPGYVQPSGNTHLNGGTLEFVYCPDGCEPGTGIFDGGSLTGSGNIGGNVLFTGVSAGSIAPGNSPGVINISGNLTLATNTTVFFEAAGTGAGQFDQINVGGSAALAGNATISFLDPYAPGGGEVFPFMTYASYSGGFGSFNGPAGYTLGEAYSPDYLVSVLGVPPPPSPPPPPDGGPPPPPPPTGGGPTPPPFPEGPTTDLLVLWYQEVWGEDVFGEDGLPEPRKLAMCR